MNSPHLQEPVVDVVARAEQFTREFSELAKKNGLRLVASAVIRTARDKHETPVGAAGISVSLTGFNLARAYKVGAALPNMYPTNITESPQYPVFVEPPTDKDTIPTVYRTW